MTGGTFREKMTNECQRIYDYAVEKFEERKVEVEQMDDCVDAAIYGSREHGTGLINEFLAYKAEVQRSFVISVGVGRRIFESVCLFVRKLKNE